MKFLFILPHYHARTSANNINMLNIAEKLIKNGDCVDILCTDGNNKIDQVTYEKGFRVFSMINVYNSAVARIGTYFHAEKIQELPPIIQIVIKGFCWLKSYNKPFTDYYAVDAISRKKIRELIDDKYDVIVSHSHPFAAHSIARDLMNYRIADNWIAVLWDPFVYNFSDPEGEIEKRKKSANRILKGADIVYVLDGIMQYNASQNWTPCFASNVKPMYLTNMSDCCTPLNNKQEESKYIITFAGAFYSGLREPISALKILSVLSDHYTIRLYGSGCRKQIKEFIEQNSNVRVEDFGVVPHSECVSAIMKSNILLNIGNTVPNQLPSKVFEYISYGKPIINLYTNPEDLSLKYFSRYPLCYSLNMNSYTESDVNGLVQFCEMHCSDCLSIEDATVLLSEYRAENVINSFIQSIYNIHDQKK